MKNNCKFTSQNHFRRNSKINIYDKRLPTVISSERAVTPFLKWFCTPTGNLAYKFFKMQNKKNVVTDSQFANVTLNAKEYHAQQFHQFIDDFFQTDDVKNYVEHQNYLLSFYLESEEAENANFKKLTHKVDLTTTQTAFLSGLKEMWVNFTHFNNLKIS